MKISSLLGFLLLFCVVLSSCDDDLRTVGGSIQPGGDDVSLGIDSMNLTARTVSMEDAIYLKSTSALLGRYEDDMYGTVQSEYLTEFFCSDTVSFGDNVASIDSSKIKFTFLSYVGDSLAPMGVSFYELNNRLDRDYYSNIDVAKYSDMSKLLTSASYTIKSAPYTSRGSKVRYVEADMGDWGQKLYDASKTSNDPLVNSKAFIDYFHGVYVKPTFGNGSMVDIFETTIDVFYTTKKDTVVKDPSTGFGKDSVMYTNRKMVFTSTPEIIQMNKVQNKLSANLLTPNTGAVYIKSPAGVCVEMELPIKDIIEKGEDRSINLARISLKGFTELEKKDPLGLNRVSALMLINKDSVKTFFEKPYREENLTSSLVYVTNRQTSTNSYTFDNIAPMIKEYKDKKIEKNPIFLLLPVTARALPVSNNNATTIGYFNTLRPSLSILRAREGDIKLEVIYSIF